MTCSARLPVYALLIAAFIPARDLGVGIGLQGLVLFALYLAGIAGAMLVAWVLKHFTSRQDTHALMMELPAYHWPRPGAVLLELWHRIWIFVRRVGTVILALTVMLWFLASWPAPPEGFTGAAIEYSLAGRLGHALAWVFAPLGFNWQISVALVPGLAAREVVVGALGTVYALSSGGTDAAEQLAPLIAQQWSLATGLALLAWFVFAPQCLATLAAIRRETGHWTMPAVVTAYLFVLGYVAGAATYQIAVALGAG